MNEDPNDPRKPIGNPNKQGPSSPSTPGGAWTVASSVNSTTQQLQQQQQQVLPIDEERERLQRQVIQWGIASGTSLTAVTIVYVPSQVLLVFFVTMSIFMGLARSVYEAALLEVGQVQRRGIVQYLPESVVNTLTQVSFHQWMVDGTFFEENQHLLLYLIPGLNRDQLDAYVNRLVPRHRDSLHRQGLGHVFGESFMRLLVGNLQYEQQQRLNGAVPRRLDFQQQIVAESPSVLGDHEDENDDNMVGFEDVVSNQPQHRVFTWEEENARQQSASIQIQNGIFQGQLEQTQDNEEDNIDTESLESEDLEVDGQVILDAITRGMNTFSDMALDTVRTVSSNFFTGTPLRTGLTMGVASVSAGLLGIWAFSGGSSGSSRMPSSPPGSPSSPRGAPPSQVIYSSILASGATAGIMYVFQFGRSSGPPGNDPSKTP
jgi:hypothetical protein